MIEIKEAHLFDAELSLINPLDRLNMLLTIWEEVDSIKTIDSYFNRIACSLLDQSDRFIAMKCIGLKAEDKYIESKKYKKFLGDALQRIEVLEGKGTHVKEIKSIVTTELEDFDSFRAILNIQCVSSPSSKSLIESVEKLKKFFLGSGFHECVKGFNNGSIFPPDMFEVEKIDMHEVTLKFSEFYLSNYIPQSQIDVFLDKMEAEKQGFSYIVGDKEEAAKERFLVTLDQVLYDEGIRIIIDILTNLETFVGMSEEKSRIETQFGKLISVLNQISYSLNTSDTDPLKVRTFKELMIDFKQELKFRYSELFDGTKEWASESLIINRSRFEKVDSEKIYKALVELRIIDNNISAKDFDNILEEGYNGKKGIHWLALTKSKEDLDKSLLLTLLKILATYGLIPQKIFINVKALNNYIKGRFVNSKGVAISILKSSFSTWKTKLEKESNDLKKFCNKPTIPVRQQMFNELYQILTEKAEDK